MDNKGYSHKPPLGIPGGILDNGETLKKNEIIFTNLTQDDKKKAYTLFLSLGNEASFSVFCECLTKAKAILDVDTLEVLEI